MHSFDSLFQFTPLREGRPGGRHARAAVRYFNSRPSARGDPAQLPNGCRSYFSIHAPPRGATSGRCAAHARPAVFNSRPSARGDAGAALLASRGKFSIHAPPRGATVSHFYSFLLPSFFNSRPSARGDMGVNTTSSRSPFQFTPLREGRPLRVAIIWDSRISIHAPPRGATAAQMFQAFLGSYFNSRPSARGDAAKARRMARRSHFNSRPSARGDVSKSGALVMNEISIHAPPRGATARPSCR